MRKKQLQTNEIEEIRKLYKEGWSLNKIGKKFNRHHTTIAYLLQREKDYMPNKKPTVTDRKPKIAEIVPKLPKPKKKDICAECGKEKGKVWHLTNFCSVQCWHSYFYKPNYKWI